LLFGGLFFLAFLVGVGLPAWWLGYLALLARPAPAGVAGGLEWYPVGHLVFWAAILGAAVVLAAMLTIGSDLDAMRAGLRSGLERMLNIQERAPSGATAAAQPALSDRVIDVLVAVLPAAAAVLTTATSVINLWLAERIVVVSGRLRRPPPDLSAMRFPVYAPMLTAAAVAGTFLAGLFGVAAGVLSASLLMAYAILGFAVLHAITRGQRSRPFTLGSVYAAVLVFGWPMIVMSILGLADTAFDFRGRAARRLGPPNPRT
jgi:Predicted membrane protein (DUF2232)